ncbi:T-complex protein 1 subunit zeta-2, partial [Galemys pyrenaicus]
AEDAIFEASPKPFLAPVRALPNDVTSCPNADWLMLTSVRRSYQFPLEQRLRLYLAAGRAFPSAAMAAIKAANSKAEVARAHAALAVNICAARGLQNVLRTNLGPKGTMKIIIAEGFEAAKIKALEVLEEVKIEKEMKREILLDVARTSLRTKVHAELADVLTEAVVDSVLAIRRPGFPIDLFMVEIMEMKHKSETDT